MDFKLEQIAIAATDISKMVKFYKAVFKIEFAETKAYGTTLFAGKVGDIRILLAPNEIAGVKAEENRHQFDFIVQDIDELIKIAEESGGKLQGNIENNNKEKTVTILDPDNNTMNFKQKL